MPPKDLFASMSANAQELMELTLSRINTNTSIARIWEALLTEPQRRSLGVDCQTAFTAHGDTAGMWIKLHRGCSRPTAIIELGKRLNLLDDLSYQWLRREIGKTHSHRDGKLPEWNPNSGQLLFGGKVIRKVRLMKKPSSLQLILDAFQAADWSESIDNPTAANKLSERLRTLNTGLKRIKFHAQAGGTEISWARA
jgi:hypothetical protein